MCTVLQHTRVKRPASRVIRASRPKTCTRMRRGIQARAYTGRRAQEAGVDPESSSDLAGLQLCNAHTHVHVLELSTCHSAPGQRVVVDSRLMLSLVPEVVQAKHCHKHSARRARRHVDIPWGMLIWYLCT
jgi:hypothetical protein